jgi:Plant mobile domain
MEYPQLLVVPQNKYRSERSRTDVNIFNRITWKKYFIINFSISYVINYFVQLHSTLHLNAHRPKIPYNTHMDSYMHRLSLYQIAIMGNYQLDKSLLATLVERWRSELSTFYLLVGEMTVTLEDVQPIRDILIFL